MTLIEVLSTIRQAGGTIAVVNGEIKLKAPAGLLTAKHKLVLAEHKHDLVRLLAPPDEERQAIVWADQQGHEQEQALGESLAYFDRFVLRPDCKGRMGWEAPGLSEADRWWARLSFDEDAEVEEFLRS